MDKKTIGVLALATLVCGCPGLCLLLFGLLASVGMVPDAFDLFSGAVVPAWLGIALLCIALIFIAIPIGVGFLTLRKRPEAEAPESGGPLPPAS